MQYTNTLFICDQNQQDVIKQEIRPHVSGRLTPRSMLPHGTYGYLCHVLTSEQN